MKLLLLCLVLFGCAKKNKEVEPKAIDVTIKQKAEMYMALHRGWAHSKCDSLGFTALCKLSGGCKEVNIFEAEAENGRWFRSPEKDCYDLGQSKSDISKDMFIMLIPYLYKEGDKDALRRIRDYALSHNFVMGRGELSRTILSPSIFVLITRMVGLPISSRDDKATRDELEKGVDFTDHLNVIWALTNAMYHGGMSDESIKYFKYLVSQEKNNALFQAILHRYTDGDQSETIRILNDQRLFPIGRLPTSADRCEEYLWQRAETPKDWQACGGDYVHDGVDFLVAAWIAGQI